MRNALPVKIYRPRPLPSEPCIRRTLRALRVRGGPYVPIGSTVVVVSHGSRYATVRPVGASYTVNVLSGELL